MGKVLIIKGADFSAVAVADVVIDGKVMLTTENYASKLSAYLNTSSTPAFSPNAQAEIMFYPILEGQWMFVPGGESSKVALVTKTEIGTTNIIATDAGFIGANGNYPGDIIMQAMEDCYVMLTAKQADTGTDIFPDGAYIANSVTVPASLTEDNLVYYADKYMKSDGTWGNETAPTGKHAAEFFLVHEGETVTVKANANANTTLAFIEFDLTLAAATAVFTQESGRVVITAGETQTFTITHQCALYIYAYSGNTVKFPESITIS